jgi:hypothetical protein
MSERRDERRRGEDLARRLPRLEMPPEAAERVRRTLRAELARPSRGRSVGTLGIGLPLAAGLVLGFMILWFVARPPGLTLEPAGAPGGALENLAIAAHAELRGEGARLDLPSESPAAVRAWLRADGFSAALVENRPPAEATRFELRGASHLGGAGFPAAAVSYRIDGRPVTLAVTTAARAPEVPRWSPLGKTVRISEDPASGAHVLTWRNAGKAYSLITELPGRGLTACLICHTDRARRDLIERLDSDS